MCQDKVGLGSLMIQTSPIIIHMISITSSHPAAVARRWSRGFPEASTNGGWAMRSVAPPSHRRWAPKRRSNSCAEKCVPCRFAGSMGTDIIYLHENHKNQVNVGEYTSPMDPMGWRFSRKIPGVKFWLRCTLSPIIMEVENGGLENDFTVVSKGAIFHCHDYGRKDFFLFLWSREVTMWCITGPLETLEKLRDISWNLPLFSGSSMRVKFFETCLVCCFVVTYGDNLISIYI